MHRKQPATAEFGDFQTPPELARRVCAVVARSGFRPASVIEPSCGRGAFLQAALEAFPDARHFLGADRNPGHVQKAETLLARADDGRQIQIIQSDFFDTDWTALMAGLPKPLLIVGNPPWVTNAALGVLESANLPKKANQDGLRGIAALTGKSNFDISEWMLRENLKWLAAAPGTLAVLCKTTVARRVLCHAWSHELPIESAAMYRIDAKLHFHASVEACLLIVHCRPGAASTECRDYSSLEAATPGTSFGIRDGTLIADIRRYERWHGLLGHGLSGWRSGIKHDCSKVFELVRHETGYENGLGTKVEIETDVVFPLLKSSDIAGRRTPRKWLLVPHQTMTASPEKLRRQAPKAWRYLVANAPLVEKRRSTIYRDRPRFSIFGVGEYSFSRWKVAISGLYKKLDFVEVSPFQNRPVVFDDTCYFFACDSAQECRALHQLVASRPAQEFWSAFVFWDAKRPITAQILNLLDFAAVARVLGVQSDVARALGDQQWVQYTEKSRQQLLIREHGQNLI